jgi:hypothetical protein
MAHTAGTLAVKAFTSVAQIATLRHFWQAKQWHPNADFEFFNLIIQCRSNVISPCVLAALRGGEPVALWVGRVEAAKVPLRFGYKTLLETPVRRLTLIEGGAIGEQTEDICRAFASHLVTLLAGQNFDLVSLEQVNVAEVQYQTIVCAFKRTQLCHAQDPAAHWTLQLPGTWEEFLKRRPKKHRYWIKRLSVVLNRDFGGEWSIRRHTSPEEAGQFVDAAESIAGNTYQRALGAGFCRNEENARRVDLAARQGQLRGYVLFIRDEPRAFWHCRTYKQTLYLSATGYDPAYRSYELGTVLLMKVFEDHCGTDIERVDFGLGDADYKRRFASDHFVETTLHLFPKTLGGLRLNAVQSLTLASTRCARYVLDKLHLTQRLKTLWRRQVEKQTGPADADKSVPVPVQMPADRRKSSTAVED